MRIKDSSSVQARRCHPNQSPTTQAHVRVVSFLIWLDSGFFCDSRFTALSFPYNRIPSCHFIMLYSTVQNFSNLDFFYGLLDESWAVESEIYLGYEQSFGSRNNLFGVGLALGCVNDFSKLYLNFNVWTTWICFVTLIENEKWVWSKFFLSLKKKLGVCIILSNCIWTMKLWQLMGCMNFFCQIGGK